jgi:putative hydrolase of the HAD superfamily
MSKAFARRRTALTAAINPPGIMSILRIHTAMTIADTSDIRAVLFDLGNVLIDIDFLRCARLWAEQSGVSAETIASRFRIDKAYRAFECGEIDSSDYFASLRRQLGINLSDDTMRTGWNTIIQGEKPGIRDCLKQLANRYPLYVLTNTNAAHESVWAERHGDLLSNFADIFVSSRMGCRKPNPSTYRHVAQTIGLPCSRILFFDDATENIDGAREAGMQAIHVETVDTIRHWIDQQFRTPCQHG